MGGPLQGFVLLGIIYWYSKGMLSLINEYYRSEFHQKLKKAPPEQKIHQLQPLSYDLDDMEQLIKMESLKDMEAKRSVLMDTKEQMPFGWNESEQIELDANEKDKRCYRLSAKLEFLNVLLLYCEKYHIPGSQLYLSLNYPICLLDKIKRN